MKLTAYDMPPRKRRKESKVDPNSITQRALAAGLDPSTVRKRVRRGMPIEQALSIPPMPKSESARRAGKARQAAGTKTARRKA